jgi:adenosylcobinamide-phosphate synthase
MIIRLELQILAAVILDLLLGDPWKLPHPVQGIGWAIGKTESLTRKLIKNPGQAGVVTWFIITAGTGALTLLLLRLFYFIHPLAGDILSILFLYTTVAARDLIKHGNHIKNGLNTGPIELARERLSMIVTRDTKNMTPGQIVLSTVESLAENISDGIVAPLFFAFISEAPLSMIYKAANTLDSMVGYKNERYLRFGWFSARVDDLLNFIPARLCALMLMLSAFSPKLDLRRAGLILKRDRKNGLSPNAGWPESVVAGALGLQFGGELRYFGKSGIKPYIGDEESSPSTSHITHAIRMLVITLLLTLLICGGVRFLITNNSGPLQ